MGLIKRHKRVFHKLSPNKRIQYPRNMVFYDTETNRAPIEPDTYLHTLKLGWAYYVRLDDLDHVHTRRWKLFRTVKEFWDFVEDCTRPHTKLYIISHNQHFDFNIVQGFKMLSEYGYSLSKVILDSSRFYVEARKDKKSIAFLDTFNYVKTSVRKLGETIGLEKLKVDFDTVDDVDLAIYCRRDVEIIAKWFLEYLRFIQDTNLGNFGKTISSQAFNAYRHRFMKHSIFIHANQEALKLERESYRGGRTEAFFIGEVPEKKIFYLDVNSLYPFVMHDMPYPTKLVNVEEYPSLKGLRNAMKNYLVIARVRVRVQEPAIGVTRSKLIFPVGTFWATLTSPELEWVLNNGKILDVDKYAIYEYANIFYDYVSFFYYLKVKAKKEHDMVRYKLAKLFLNSLYGKFGQKARQLECIIEGQNLGFGPTQVLLPDRDKPYQGYFVGDKLYISVDKGEWYNSFPAIASFVTSYARMYLWLLIKTAGRRNVYYCDTDSLFVNEDGYLNLADYEDDYELGKLKLEGIFKKLIIYGAKDYVLDGKVKLKGIPRKADQVDANTYVFDTFDKTRTLLRNRIVIGVIERKKTKHLSRRYDKGKVTLGGRVEPFKLAETREYKEIVFKD